MGGWLAAVQAAGDAMPDTGAAPYLAGGSTGLLATCLLLILRRMLDGRLVVKNVQDERDELGKLIIAAGDREAEMMRRAAEMTGTAEATRAELRDVVTELQRLRQSVDGRG